MAKELLHEKSAIFGSKRRRKNFKKFSTLIFVEDAFENSDACPIFAVLFENREKMYAIVNIAGQQIKVEKDKFVYAPLLDGEAGAKVDFDQVLLVDQDGKVKVGSPTVKGASVSGKILEHVKGDKVIVFKKKRRKGYRVKNGHRQQFSKVLIEEIKG